MPPPAYAYALVITSKQYREESSTVLSIFRLLSSNFPVYQFEIQNCWVSYCLICFELDIIPSNLLIGTTESIRL
jgi:hypothetical protein